MGCDAGASSAAGSTNPVPPGDPSAMFATYPAISVCAAAAASDWAGLTLATAFSMRRERRSISAAVRSIVVIGVCSLQPAR